MMSHTPVLLRGGGVLQTGMLGNDEGEQTAYPVEFGGTDVGEMTSEGKGGVVPLQRSYL